MLKLAAAAYVFLGGFAVMVLEIIGARYLAKDFGGSFYVWISQIGVILVALALGWTEPLARRPGGYAMIRADSDALVRPNRSAGRQTWGC